MNIKGYSDYSEKAIVICGCKQDLEDQREMLVDEGRDLAKDWRVPFIETSAKMNTNVTEVFEMTGRIVIKFHDIN